MFFNQKYHFQNENELICYCLCSNYARTQGRLIFICGQYERCIFVSIEKRWSKWFLPFSLSLITQHSLGECGKFINSERQTYDIDWHHRGKSKPHTHILLIVILGRFCYQQTDMQFDIINFWLLSFVGRASWITMKINTLVCIPACVWHLLQHSILININAHRQSIRMVVYNNGQLIWIIHDDVIGQKRRKTIR